MEKEELPGFEDDGEGNIIPCVNLPPNFKELVSGFYEGGGKEAMEAYVQLIGKVSKIEITLEWGKKRGLKYIFVGEKGIYKLEEENARFVGEYLWDKERSFPAYLVAERYQRLLLL